MHTAIVHLAPVFAAEKSKTPFYIAGGLLVAWALILSLGIGLRNVSFPSTLGAERTVMAITAALVVLTVSMAVATSGGSTEKATAAGSSPTPEKSSSTPSETTASAPTAPPAKRGGGKATTEGGTSSLKEAADPEGQLRFASKDLTTKAGKVKIEFTNASPVPHNMTVSEGTQILGGTPTFQGGGAKTLTLNLKPGTYKFYCSVPGHRAAGMEGTLTVQ